MHSATKWKRQRNSFFFLQLPLKWRKLHGTFLVHRNLLGFGMTFHAFRKMLLSFCCLYKKCQLSCFSYYCCCHYPKGKINQLIFLIKSFFLVTHWIRMWTACIYGVNELYLKIKLSGDSPDWWLRMAISGQMARSHFLRFSLMMLFFSCESANAAPPDDGNKTIIN